MELRMHFRGFWTRQQALVMPIVSAGLLMYRKRAGKLEVLLVHPGGPFWRNKDLGAWSIPKGEVNEEEELLEAARREFEEETGCTPNGQFLRLSAVKQKSGKMVHAWAVAGDLNPAKIKSNIFTMEWPPKSRKRAKFPEVDRAEFFDLDTAKGKIIAAQLALLSELAKLVRL
jgi:predicted NUDIX family NTP pyrophosphohydrolase